jgi:hypothetical protein
MGWTTAHNFQSYRYAMIHGSFLPALSCDAIQHSVDLALQNDSPDATPEARLPGTNSLRMVNVMVAVVLPGS